ncbi:MAG: rhodanese-like domain-containing protein [Methanimicrococcus sp.]|nr:rhodanese-like domain-containing protein [Methanimicrococcus sp.]
MICKREPPKIIQSLIAEKNIYLIDVRSSQERLSDGYIAESMLIDIRGPDFEMRLNKLDKNKMLILYCRAGNRSLNAAGKAEQAGFKDICMIEGGINAWKSQGFPVKME